MTLTYEDGMAVEMFDHVEIGQRTPSPFFSNDWEITEHYDDLPEGQVTAIYPRKKEVRVRYPDGFTRRGKTKFTTETLPIAEVALMRRDG